MYVVSKALLHALFVRRAIVVAAFPIRVLSSASNKRLLEIVELKKHGLEKVEIRKALKYLTYDASFRSDHGVISSV